MSEALAERARRSGPGNLSDAERRALSVYLGGLTPSHCIREAYGRSEHANETAVDEVWAVLGREPNAGEYRALAVLFRQAARDLDTKGAACELAERLVSL